MLDSTAERTPINVVGSKHVLMAVESICITRRDPASSARVRTRCSSPEESRGLEQQTLLMKKQQCRTMSGLGCTVSTAFD